MISTLDLFPSVSSAIVEIGYDNGCINRYQSVETWLSDCHERINDASVLPDEMLRLDLWLRELTPVQLGMICSGEETEREQLEVLMKVPRDDQARPLTRILDIAFDGDSRD